MGNKNLHLLWDEKITPGIIDNFETVLPGQNDYIYWWEPKNKIHFAKEGENCKVIKNEGEVPDLDYSQYTRVIIHALDPRKVKFCLHHIPNNIPVYWLMWGADLYSLLDRKGYKLLYNNAADKSWERRCKRLITRMGYNPKHIKEYLSIFKDREVIMVGSEEEYEIFCDYYPEYTRTLKNNPNFFYYPVEKILGELAACEAKGNRILVGNSNSFTNNHSYAFKYLKDANLTNREITVPLSYGGSTESKELVIGEGMKLFGSQFTPLTDFLPLDRYNQIMTEAEYAVYGNWRQEAMGNILVALYLGTKVFLSKKNPLLQIFKDMGIIIFELEDIGKDAFQVPLTKEQRKHNRRIIAERYSFAKMQENIETLFG